MSIAVLIRKIYSKYKKSQNSDYFEIIYLFNPISIINCSKLRIDIFTTFINLIFVNYYESFVGVLSLILGLLISPNFFMTNFFFLVFIFKKKLIHFNFNFLKNCFLSILILYVSLDENIFSFELNKLILFVKETSLIYLNYFTIKDTHPNLGLFWYLLPEVKILL